MAQFYNPGLRVYDNVLQMVGDTPLVRLNNIKTGDLDLFAKLEAYNPQGSSKDRAVVSMLEDAKKRGLLDGKVVTEPTSGNTGIALAGFAAHYGFKVQIATSDKIPRIKRLLMELAGAKVDLIEDEVCPIYPGEGAIGYSRALVQSPATMGIYFSPDQYNNPKNIEGQRKMGDEIWEQTSGTVDYVFIAIGTLGTISGVGQVLKEKKPSTKVIGIDTPRGMKYFGMKSYEDVKQFDLHRYAKIDELITIDDAEIGFLRAIQLLRKEGIKAGLTSGVVLEAASRFSKSNAEGIGVLVFPDSIDRYFDEFERFLLSTPDLESKLATLE